MWFLLFFVSSSSALAVFFSFVEWKWRHRFQMNTLLLFVRFFFSVFFFFVFDSRWILFGERNAARRCVIPCRCRFLDRSCVFFFFPLLLSFLFFSISLIFPSVPYAFPSSNERSYNPFGQSYLMPDFGCWSIDSLFNCGSPVIEFIIQLKPEIADKNYTSRSFFLRVNNLFSGLF